MVDATKFVQLVENYPCLYKNNLAEYSKKDVTERAWAAIGVEMNWSVPDCKEKWKNLRNGFVRSLKPSPSGYSTKAKRRYYLHDIMQFVLPYVKPVHHSENTSNIIISEMEEQYLDEIENGSIADDNYSDCAPTKTGSLISNNLESHPAKESNFELTFSAKKRNKTARDEVDVAVLNYLKTKKGNTTSEDPTKKDVSNELTSRRKKSFSGEFAHI
ncbi:uncharacterized protein [Eurosta solidaginis]|uniref:uncharacterized protein n=1 Tax=Eurosta solidaginis TaxID=178769 RepID=UPI0035316B43